MCAKSFTVEKMVDRILVERILSEITAEVNDLKNATDITWEVYKTNKRARRFVKGLAKNNLSFSHPIFRPSSSNPQPQSPRNSSLFLWL